jgi:Fur family ferric uptake transcriptional regulator
MSKTKSTPSPARSSRDLLQDARLKVTGPRLSVIDQLRQFAERSEHVAAEEIYLRLHEAGEPIGLGTVYRVLAHLVDHGIVERHQFAGRTVFELVQNEEHDHMCDVNGGTVLEFSDAMIRARLQKLAREKGYEIIQHELIVYVRPVETRARRAGELPK